MVALHAGGRGVLSRDPATHPRARVAGLKSDIALGLYLVRGDNVVLLGELDAAKEAALGLTDADPAAVREAEDKTSKVEWDFDKLEKL